MTGAVLKLRAFLMPGRSCDTWIEPMAIGERGSIMRDRAYQNTVLTVIAVLLAANMLGRPGAITEPAAAHAQVGGSDPGGMTNALEQRKQMINELRQIGSRLDRIESKINGGLNVKVTEMPPLRMPTDQRSGD